VLLLALVLVLPLMLLHSVIPTGSPMHTVLFRIALLLPLSRSCCRRAVRGPASGRR
jgi:hypothetical protein